MRSAPSQARAQAIYALETITEYERPHRRSYTVAGLPVRDYRCTVELAPARGGTGIRFRPRPQSPRPAPRRSAAGTAEPHRAPVRGRGGRRGCPVHVPTDITTRRYEVLLPARFNQRPDEVVGDMHPGACLPDGPRNTQNSYQPSSTDPLVAAPVQRADTTPAGILQNNSA